MIAVGSVCLSAFDLIPGVLRRVLSGDVTLFRQTAQVIFSFHAHHEMRAALKIETEPNVGSE